MRNRFFSSNNVYRRTQTTQSNGERGAHIHTKETIFLKQLSSRYAHDQYVCMKLLTKLNYTEKRNKSHTFQSGTRKLNKNFASAFLVHANGHNFSKNSNWKFWIVLSVICNRPAYVRFVVINAFFFICTIWLPSVLFFTEDKCLSKILCFWLVKI